jgi:imidazolonepropionase-like amidohydrolase
MRHSCLALTLAFLGAAPWLGAADDAAGDLRSARSLFEKNIDAIRRRDREAYLACYRRSDHLARGGPTGFVTGFEEFVKAAGERWPDVIDASDLHLVPVQAGVVYGTYRYRVRYGKEEHTGISERLFTKTPEGWKVVVTGAIDAPPGTPPPPRALVGATLIDGRGGPPVPAATVVLRGGKIDCAGTAAQCPLPESIDVTDLKGLWLTPGLIDAHVHFSQTGWADGRPDSLDLRAAHPYEMVEADLRKHPDRFGRSYLCSGVTAVFDVGGYPWTLQLPDGYAQDTLMPHVVAAGPLLSTLDHWLTLPGERQFLPLTSELAAREGVRYLKAQGAHAVKVWYIVRPPTLTVEASEKAVMAAGDEARHLGLPLIVHATGLAEAKVALRAGAKLLVHSVWDVPVDQEFLDLARQNGTILNPTLTVGRGYVRMFRALIDRKAPTVDDPNHCVDEATLAKVASTAVLEAALVNAATAEAREQRVAQNETVAASNLAKLVAAGIPIATGTDAGNPLTLHGPAIYAEMEAMQSAGMTPMQVIAASTAVASRAMGLEAEIGTIEKGKAADLIAVGGDPSQDVRNFRKLRYVVRGGELRTPEDLRP